MALVYLIPAPLHEEGMSALPVSVTDAIRDCSVLFVENERTTRRYFKQLWRNRFPGEEIVIDNYEWHTIDDNTAPLFRKALGSGKNIGIISEAGCPGVADPGQALVAIAQEMKATVRPVTGPSSILLALMASGMNGQQFRFAGYLPIDAGQRATAIKQLETFSAQKNSTQIFIETPYRNNQLLEALISNCHPATRLCIAKNLTGPDEYIQTRTIREWKEERPDLHKQPVIFLLQS